MLLDTSYKMIEKNYLNFELIIVYNDNIDDKLNEPVSRLLHGLTKGDCLIYSKGKNSFNDLFLNDVSKMEFGGSNVIDDLKFRKNHMCEENHYILYQYIVDTLRGKENKPNFIKNVFNSDYIYE